MISKSRSVWEQPANPFCQRRKWPCFSWALNPFTVSCKSTDKSIRQLIFSKGCHCACLVLHVRIKQRTKKSLPSGASMVEEAQTRKCMVRRGKCRMRSTVSRENRRGTLDSGGPGSLPRAESWRINRHLPCEKGRKDCVKQRKQLGDGGTNERSLPRVGPRMKGIRQRGCEGSSDKTGQEQRSQILQGIVG